MAMFSSRESLVDDDSFPPLVRPSSVPAASTPGPGKRIVSLPVKQQENIHSIRRYKSMLDVDEAPKLPATKPLTYDELYVGPLAETMPTPAAGTLEVGKYWKSSRTWPRSLPLHYLAVTVDTGTHLQPS